MSLPFAPIPPATVRLSLGPEEWEACLDAWLTLSDALLSLSRDQFRLQSSEKGSLPAFLASFYHELDRVQPEDHTLGTPKALSLRKACFKLIARILSGDAPIPVSSLDWGFLSSFCHAHMKSVAASQLLSRVWKKKSELLIPNLQKQKDAITQALDSKNVDPAIPLLTRLAPVIYLSPDIGAFFLTGSDFLDSLVAAYSRTVADHQKKAISTVVYLGLVSWVKSDSPNNSILYDHLYTLKSQGQRSPPDQSVIADVVTNTSLLAKTRHSLGNKAPERLVKLLDTLETCRTPSIARAKKRNHRSRSRAKGKQPVSKSELHVHQLSLVTQVQDLFPDLGSAFVLKLLGEYNDDVEQVTAHLLDDSLPPHLASLDRTEQAPIFDTSLDRLDFDTSRLHIGKRSKSTASSDQPNKAAILSALAAFDSDDDERDDTYDGEDVGGTIDSANPDGEPGPAAKVTQEENDMALFTAYKSAPEIFGRTFDVRRSQARAALKSETGMSDEQIEGWAVMLQRDPKRLKRLEAQAGNSFAGQQPELARTSYRESPGNTETEDSDAAQGGRGGFRGRGRGRGRGGGGRGGGNVAGPSSDPNTAQAQRRKEASKSSRANHNRRQQRAKKMARGGFPG
ncbi:uncharacterized protein MYCFIDRAFT_145360 [Pseudocercospora fijiensis CIRAD86]|uniref:CUE domain-containing protein n=1 Tax=Pseudocercospora fijiensis (strain CIRAD86) TaxID=383855 RepID=M3A0K3_PSEFD|nr:uncharacterized protein MYCFIDRAFT_145360 [Pseudocercospora fijiensis CIRAD86]EME77936.1 hypothetical protein MYCFIDRAFT_145360 [Pseudocercospora fijiensis CIRAD86]